jgi:hypothetical protein
LTLFWVLSAAATASAATYTVYGCSLPNGRAVQLDGWSLMVKNDPAGGVQGQNLCTGTDPKFTMEHANPSGASRTWAHDTYAMWRFTAPAGTVVDSVALSGRTFSPSNSTDIAWEAWAPGVRQEYCFLTSCSLPANITYAGVRGAHFDIRTVCGSSGAPCSGSTNNYVWVRRAAVTIADDSAPTASAPPSGPLLERRALAGTQAVTLALADAGGGLWQASLEVDGTRVATQPVDGNGGHCAQPFTRAVPCKTAAVTTVPLDTTRVADGRHVLRVLATDAAGNTLSLGPYDIDVRNAASTCGPSTAGRVTAHFRRGGAVRTVRLGRGARISGRVRDPAGAPVAGAEVRLLRRIDRRGSAQTLVGRPLITDAKGRFTARLAPGPSRALRYGWRRAGEAFLTCSRRIHLRVRARATLRAVRSVVPRSAPRGVFRGRLLGGWVPRGGKTVVLEGASPGRGWRVFAQGRTTRSGRFRISYRFSGAPATVRVRLRVPADDSYPYAPGVSRAVTLRVR